MLGKNQKKMLQFYARNHKQWHTFATDSLTVRTATSLQHRGLLILHGEFKNMAKVTILGLEMARQLELT